MPAEPLRSYSLISTNSTIFKKVCRFDFSTHVLTRKKFRTAEQASFFALSSVRRRIRAKKLRYLFVYLVRFPPSVSLVPRDRLMFDYVSLLGK